MSNTIKWDDPKVTGLADEVQPLIDKLCDFCHQKEIASTTICRECSIPELIPFMQGVYAAKLYRKGET